MNGGLDCPCSHPEANNLWIVGGVAPERERRGGRVEIDNEGVRIQYR